MDGVPLCWLQPFCPLGFLHRSRCWSLCLPSRVRPPCGFQVGIEHICAFWQVLPDIPFPFLKIRWSLCLPSRVRTPCGFQGWRPSGRHCCARRWRDCRDFSCSSFHGGDDLNRDLCDGESSDFDLLNHYIIRVDSLKATQMPQWRLSGSTHWGQGIIWIKQRPGGRNIQILSLVYAQGHFCLQLCRRDCAFWDSAHCRQAEEG